MKVNQQHYGAQPPRRPSGAASETQKSQPQGDQVEIQSTPASRPQPRVEKSRQEKPRLSPSLKSQLQDLSRLSSVQSAGVSGLPGAIAVANLHYPDGRWNLKAIADQKMQELSLAIDYPPEVQAQVAEIMAQTRPAPGVYNLPPDAHNPWVKDLRSEHFLSVDNGRLWTSVDAAQLQADPEANMTSRDLDQIQGKPVKLPNGDIQMKIAVSDVDAFVKKGSPIDRFMDVNGSSVYTPDKIYNLIPKELAEDVISLNPREDRLATVIQFTVSPEGQVKDEDCYQALVRSRAKLDYASVGAWFDGSAEPSPAMLQDGEILESLTLQDEVAQRLKQARKDKGSLEFESNEINILTQNGSAVGFEKAVKNRATELVENCMVTANEVMHRFQHRHNMPSLDRVVVPPEKWDRIVDLAEQKDYDLPGSPNSKALSKFLESQRQSDPEGFKDLSFSVIKLIGRGEYQAVPPGEPSPGHFGLASDGYSQCTASIRRGGDRMATRMLKAALAGEPSPYSDKELKDVAENLTQKESQTKKVERAIEKSVIASMLEDRLGQSFHGVISGVKGDRAWVRISDPPVEGSLQKAGKVEVGQSVNMILDKVNVEKGFIDFIPA